MKLHPVGVDAQEAAARHTPQRQARKKTSLRSLSNASTTGCAKAAGARHCRREGQCLIHNYATSVSAATSFQGSKRKGQVEAARTRRKHAERKKRRMEVPV